MKGIISPTSNVSHNHINESNVYKNTNDISNVKIDTKISVMYFVLKYLTYPLPPWSQFSLPHSPPSRLQQPGGGTVFDCDTCGFVRLWSVRLRPPKIVRFTSKCSSIVPLSPRYILLKFKGQECEIPKTFLAITPPQIVQFVSVRI